MLHGRLLHELADHSDWIADVGSGDGQIDKASDNLSELFLIAGRVGIGTKLLVPVQGCGDRSTCCHAELVQHIQHIMALRKQYAVGGSDHLDPKKIMKVPWVLHLK